MAQYFNPQAYNAQHTFQSAPSAQNLQFFPSTYPSTPGHTTPAPPAYDPYHTPAPSAYQMGAGGASGPIGGGVGYGRESFDSGTGGISGRMGEAGGLRTGWLAAFGTEGYEGEPPLLEELGINFDHIRMKTLTVLNPFVQIDKHLMDDSDLYGALLYIIMYGTNLLLAGKVFYGYIYGVAVFGTAALHLILSLMSPTLDTPGSPPDIPGMGVSMTPDPTSYLHSQPQPLAKPMESDPQHAMAGHFSSTLTFPRSASVLGYCFLPLVITSLIGIVIPMDSLFGYLLTTAAVGWCTYSSSGMFCAVARMHGMRFLVAYPLALFYVVFGIMGIFSSRGSGALSGVTQS